MRTIFPARTSKTSPSFLTELDAGRPGGQIHVTEREDRLAEVAELPGAIGEAFPRLAAVLPPNLSRAVMTAVGSCLSLKARLDRRVPLDVGIELRQKGVQIIGIPRLDGALDGLHVLLRHRPPSIPPLRGSVPARAVDSLDRRESLAGLRAVRTARADLVQHLGRHQDRPRGLPRAARRRDPVCRGGARSAGGRGGAAAAASDRLAARRGARAGSVRVRVRARVLGRAVRAVRASPRCCSACCRSTRRCSPACCCRTSRCARRSCSAC